MSAGSPEVGLLITAHCKLCVRVYCKDLSLSHVHGSVDCAIFSMCGNYACAMADGADSGYIFVPIASCPERGESAIEPIALA